MCHFTVDLNTCHHLSKTYRNVESCSQKHGKCNVDLNAYYSADKLTETIDRRSAIRGHFKPRYKSFVELDERSRSVVSFEFNDDTPCSRCAPMQYARYMERQERREYRYQRGLDAKAAQRTGEVVDVMMEELDLMIDEGHRRGSLAFMKEGKNRIGAGLRRKSKSGELRVSFLKDIRK